MAMLTIPVTKAKSSVEIDSEKLPQDVYEEALKLGLKELVNRGMSKETKAAHNGDEAKLAASTLKIAEKNVEKIYASEIKFAGKKVKSDVSREVMTEALRLAKNLVKDGIKAAGMKISHVKPTEITTAAKALLAEDASLTEQAKVNLEERAKTPVKLDIKALIKEDPTLVAKAADAAAKKKKDKPLSAAQAGKVKPRAKPQAGATQH